MAVTHHSTKLCDYLVQGIDGKMTFAGIFTNLHSPEVPFEKAVGLAVEFYGDPGDHFQVFIEGPNEFHVNIVEGQLSPLPPARQYEQVYAVVAGMVNMRFETFGVYCAVLNSNGQSIHRYPFGVITGDQNQGEA